MFAEAAISYSLKLQRIVTILTCKVNNIVICEVEKEVVYLRYLLAKLEFWKKLTLVILYTNHQGFIMIWIKFKF